MQQQTLPSFKELLSDVNDRRSLSGESAQPSYNSLPGVRASGPPPHALEDVPSSRPRTFAANPAPRAMPSLNGYAESATRYQDYTSERQVAHRRPSFQARSPPLSRETPHVLQREYVPKGDLSEVYSDRAYYHTAPRQYSPSSNGHSSSGHSPELPVYDSRRSSIYDTGARTAYPPMAGAPVAGPALDRYGSEYSRYSNPVYNRAPAYPLSYGMGDHDYHPHYISETQRPGYGVMGYEVSDMKNKKRRGNLPKPITDILRSWFLEHLDHPYPSEEDKQLFIRRTGLTMSQISNWFINARRRQLPTLRNTMRAQEHGKHPRSGSQASSLSP